MKKLMRCFLAIIFSLFIAMIPLMAIAAQDEVPMALLYGNCVKLGSSETYTHDSRFQTGYKIYDVIDVSVNNGTVNWDDVAASGIKYAMIRAGYRGYGNEGTIKADNNFITNVNGAVAAGISVGVYFYSQAVTVEEAIAEADFTINAMNGLEITLPVAFDFEYAEKWNHYTGRVYDANLTKDQVTAMCNAFCDRVSTYGYRPMIYANSYSLNDLMNASQLKGSVWVAQYRSSCNYAGDYMMWQYSSTGSVNGISGNVDRSYMYVLDEQTPEEKNTTVIALSQSSVTLDVGNGTQLVYAVNSNAIDNLYDESTTGEVTFTSSDNNVVTVDESGNLMAKAAGSAIVTVTVNVDENSGTEIIPHSHTVTCEVTVIEPATDEENNDNTSSDNDSFSFLSSLISILGKFLKWIISLINSLTSILS